MKKSRFTETEIISILKQADSGIKVSDLPARFLRANRTCCLNEADTENILRSD
jgi:hypothetical protein